MQLTIHGKIIISFCDMNDDFVMEVSPGLFLITKAGSWPGLIEHYPAFA